MQTRLSGVLFVLAILLASVRPSPAAEGKRPDAKTIIDLQTITLFYRVTDAGLELSWTPTNQEPSGGFKITASADQAEPLYPFDGYVVWLPGTGHTSCTVPRAKAASDRPRHWRVCSVHRDNHRKYVALSNVVIVPPVAAGKKPAHRKARPTKPADDATPPVTKVAEFDTAPAGPDAQAPARPKGALVIGHGQTDTERIPADALDRARRTLRVWYGHTSHGSQITSGMSAMNEPPFHYNRTGADGALQYVETGGDLGHHGDDRWAQRTRTYLGNGGEANVIVWSWCGGCSDNTSEGIDRYLELMDRLEADYPDRVFVYMTGHLDGTGANGTLHRNNERIRAYCRKHGKVLFDFADIESYTPDGRSVLDKQARDNCDYREDGRRRNWAAEWLAAHPDHGIALPERSAHTHPLNGALKGRAFWHLLARLAGWQP